MPDVSEILLGYVAPLLGIVVGNYMWYAPYQDVQKALQRGSLGDLNPLPWAFMLGNCIGWVTYGILRHNYFVFFGNIFGLLLAVWFNLAASKLLYRQQQQQQQHYEVLPVVLGLDGSQKVTDVKKEQAAIRTEDAPPMESPAAPTSTTPPPPSNFRAPRHDYWTLAMVLLWAAVLAVLGFGTSLTEDMQQWIVGITANLNLLYFYAAPLSTIALVLQTKSTASIHVPTMMVNTANAVFWTAYGMAVLDYFIFVPNGCGALLGLVQMALCVLFPRHTSTAAAAAVVVVRDDNASDSGLPLHHHHTHAATTTIMVGMMAMDDADDDDKPTADEEAPRSGRTLLTAIEVDTEDPSMITPLPVQSFQDSPSHR